MRLVPFCALLCDPRGEKVKRAHPSQERGRNLHRLVSAAVGSCHPKGRRELATGAPALARVDRCPRTRYAQNVGCGPGVTGSRHLIECDRGLCLVGSHRSLGAGHHFVSGASWRVPTTIRVDAIGHPQPEPTLIWSSEPDLLEAHAGPGLLEGFLKLGNAANEAILRYARRWGPLWLCGHVLPMAHEDGCWTVHEIEERDGDPSGAIIWWQEPISGWRTVSRDAGAVVRIARQLHNGQFGRHDDWESMLYLPEVMRQLLYAKFAEEGVDEAEVDAYGVDDVDEREDDFEVLTPRQRRLVERLMMSRLYESVEFQRDVLSEVLNYWLTVATVRPRLHWSGGKPEIQLGGGGLFGALAVQLLFECARTDGLAVCTSCGTPFLPAARRPRRDHNAYCSDCGLKAAQRDAAARYRQTAKYMATYGKWLEKRRGSPT